MTKQTKIIFLIVLVVVAIAVNWQQFQNKTRPSIAPQGPAMTATVSDFSGSMDETAVLQKTAIPLKCINDASALPLGDRVCYSNISSYAGISAIRVAFFFKDGHLANFKIDVPGPLHSEMAKQLTKQLGPPTGAQNTPVKGVRLIGWKLEHGSVMYNRDPDQGDWNTIHWLSESESERLGGVFISPKEQR